MSKLVVETIYIRKKNKIKQMEQPNQRIYKSGLHIVFSMFEAISLDKYLPPNTIDVKDIFSGFMTRPVMIFKASV